MSDQTMMLTLRLELLDISPLIWRWVRVPADIDLATLHYVFQIAMGWTDTHDHSFIIDSKEYCAEVDEDDNPSYADDLTLNRALNGKREFVYTYDSGDNWQHKVIVESAHLMDEDWGFPVCLAGERACPPEDVGGEPGYGEFLQLIAEPGADGYDEALLWVGGVFNPESFDVNRVNRELHGLCLTFEEPEDDF